ncbi:MAG: rhomboid family intramembrane serine protease [Flavobacteriales bacterium]
MLDSFHPILIIIMAVTALTSYFGFSNHDFFNKNAFNISAIKSNKEYHRFLTSGFLHVNGMHLIFNMLSLYFFSSKFFINMVSMPIYLLIYFGSILTGGLLGCFFHKNNPHYTAVGASGGVSGMIYASIALFPTQSEIGLIFLPGLSIPAWIFGILYMIYSVYGMKNQVSNIGHSAHIGGAVFGLLIPLIIFPGIIYKNGVYIILISIPVIYLLFNQYKKTH